MILTDREIRALRCIDQALTVANQSALGRQVMPTSFHPNCVRTREILSRLRQLTNKSTNPWFLTPNGFIRRVLHIDGSPPLCQCPITAVCDPLGLLNLETCQWGYAARHLGRRPKGLRPFINAADNYPPYSLKLRWEILLACRLPLPSNDEALG
jgi:hypothetical protein